MSNLSQKKRQEMLDYITQLKEIHNDDESIIALNNIENALTEKKYGLVWEKHSEQVDRMLDKHVPVFTEDEKRIIKGIKETSYNFLLEGDNLHSLKLLQKTHKNRVDVIYIDPPYNTSNSLTYNDKRVSADDSYRHSKWLSFMEERLRIARELLSEDGIFFASIDDNEGYQLKILCDEIFGESNFIGSFAVIKAEGGGMAKHLVKGHDMLFVYAKDINKRFPLARPKDIRGKIIQIYGVEYWIQEDAIRKTFGQYGNLHYEEILDYRDEGFKQEIDNGINNKEYILVKKDSGMHVIGKLRRIDEDYSKFYSVIKHLNADGVRELEMMGLSGIFDYPKPVSLIQELIEGATFIKKDEYIILDFFAGSGTTGEAVIRANQKDGKNRRFILCTNNEVSARQKLAFVQKLGYLKTYRPAKNTTDNAIDNKIEKELESNDLTMHDLISKNKNLYEEHGIAKTVTHPRIKKINDGFKSQVKKEVELFSRKITINNFKNSKSIFDQIEKIESKNEYSEYKLRLKDGSIKLFGLVEKGQEIKPIPCNLKYYKTDYMKKFDKDEEILSERLLSHIKEMVELENMCEIDGEKRVLILSQEDLYEWFDKGMIPNAKVYLPSYILLSREIETEGKKKDIEFVDIPDYYFLDELREVNEL